MHSLRRILPLFAWALLINGCVANRIYRPGSSAVQMAPVVGGVASTSNFKLGIIEFDDMGESWEKCTSLADPNNCQLSRVLNMIREEKKSGDVVVIVFTHGWKNNASRDNEEKKNLYEFKLLMDGLSREEPAMNLRMQQRTPGQAAPARPRTYIGVYLGWRGQSIPGDLFFTFWNRRDAAQRVGSSDYAEAIYRLMATTKENSPNSRIVIVGHSFGARVLETAITNTFVSLLVPAPDSAGQAGAAQQISPADLILYVNSATDSFRTKELIELMKRTNFTVTRGAVPHGPLFLSVTSTGDDATKIAFPLGQGISAASKNFRSEYVPAIPGLPPQKTFFTHTPGHLPFLYSHIVEQVSQPCESTENFRFMASGNCFEMTPVQNRWNDSPFWVVTVPPSIIRDHNDIFNPAFVTMITKLMERYEVLESTKPTTMVRLQ
ncbi:MAG TPA: hypothetical protein VGF01_07615 [Terracidiphilus sp.]